MSDKSRSNADFHEKPAQDDFREPGSDGKSTPDAKRTAKMRDIEKNVRGNKGLAEARTDRGTDGSETEAALKRATTGKPGRDR